MITTIKKIGNSSGIIIPAPLLNQLEFCVGTKVDLQADKGALRIEALKPRVGKNELSLDWLLEDFKDIHGDLLGQHAPAA